MQNRLEKELNVQDVTSASVSTPSAWSINVFSEWWFLKHKNSAWDVKQHVSSDTQTSWWSVISNMIEITQVQYDALWTPDAWTLYIINW